MKKYYYVKRLDAKHNGSVVEIPESSVQQTLRTHPTWIIIDQTYESDATIKTDDTPKSTALSCPICGATSVSEHGLKVHKARKHQ